MLTKAERPRLLGAPLAQRARCASPTPLRKRAALAASAWRARMESSLRGAQRRSNPGIVGALCDSWIAASPFGLLAMTAAAPSKRAVL